ncbi:MAG: Cro/Cl family transcriptional regulator [Rhodoferax sp.]|nr:Cro/Cl family transcriptional regulator [Rhodoferax sp.]
MLKTQPIELLGGTRAAAAKAIGISYQAVNAWPDELPPRIADRVYAVWGKKNMPTPSTHPTEAQAGQGA